MEALREFKDYYNNKILRHQGFLDEYGLRQGLYKSYFESGRIKNILSFEDGIEQGVQKRYNYCSLEFIKTKLDWNSNGVCIRFVYGKKY